MMLLALLFAITAALLVLATRPDARPRYLVPWSLARFFRETDGGMPVVRAFPIFINSKKVGEAHGVAFSLQPNRQRLYGAEGMLALSRGAVTCGVEVDMIVPVGGTSVDMLALLIQQKDVGVQLPIGGKTYDVDMGFTDGNVNGNTETGVVNGKFTLQGPAPKIV